MRQDLVSATGTDGDYVVELRMVPVLVCPNSHETTAPIAQFDYAVAVRVYNAEIPLAKSKDELNPTFECPSCGREAASMPVAQTEAEIKIRISTLNPFNVHLRGPFATCVDCGKSFLLPRRTGMSLGAALVNSLSAAGLNERSRQGDSLRFIAALLLFFLTLIGWGWLLVKGFVWSQPKAGSGFEALLLFVLLLFGMACMLLLTIVSWMLLTRPFLREEQMRWFLFSSSAGIPFWNRFFGKLVEILY